MTSAGGRAARPPPLRRLGARQLRLRLEGVVDADPGLDAILPPTEAKRLYDALPGPKTFLYLSRATHIGLSHIDLWTAAAADWLDARLGA